MAYTPGLGRTPAIVATRLVSSTLAAGATFALALRWPFAWTPEQGVVLSLLGIGALGLFLGLAVPKFAENRPIRVVAIDGGVVIPARRVTMAHVMYIALSTWGLAGLFATANGMEGPRGSSPVAWAVISTLLAFALVYLLVQRPWKRRIELRPAELVLGTGEEAAHIPWDDVASIVQAPLLSHARSGMRHMREYNAAAITVTRYSDTAPRRRRRLEDHFPTGDLACPFPTLVMSLQFLQSHPDERRLTTDPEAVRALLNAVPDADPHPTPSARHR